MIRGCREADFTTILEIINEAAQAYKGVIPDDCWHEPYMSSEELRHEIEDGIDFWGLERDGQLLGVMGIQDRGDLALRARRGRGAGAGGPPRPGCPPPHRVLRG